jgi:hypothetical protein
VSQTTENYKEKDEFIGIPRSLCRYDNIKKLLLFIQTFQEQIEYSNTDGNHQI